MEKETSTKSKYNSINRLNSGSEITKVMVSTSLYLLKNRLIYTMSIYYFIMYYSLTSGGCRSHPSNQRCINKLVK